MKKKIFTIITLGIFLIGVTGCGDTNENKWILTEDNNSNGRPDFGELICFNDECFNVLSYDGDYIEMLASKNIKIDDKNVTIFSDKEPKYYGGEYNYMGSDFNGSKVELYLNEYENNLNGLGAEIKSTYLLNSDKLKTLGCSISSDYVRYNCKDVDLDFMTTSDYWTLLINKKYISGSTYRDFSTYTNVKDLFYDTRHPINTKTELGIRPIVRIEASQLNKE